MRDASLILLPFLPGALALALLGGDALFRRSERDVSPSPVLRLLGEQRDRHHEVQRLVRRSLDQANYAAVVVAARRRVEEIDELLREAETGALGSDAKGRLAIPMTQERAWCLELVRLAAPLAAP
ncbi:MAG: hypothetical protein MUC42_05965 [Bryobacter sp.]|nr:hypothetical protein [Bryobacter sp.]